jgi:hypothetical protein
LDHRIAQEAYDKVAKHFFKDHKKTWKWFTTHNIDGLTPLEMIKRGRVKKLLRYIDKFMT